MMCLGDASVCCVLGWCCVDAAMAIGCLGVQPRSAVCVRKQKKRHGGERFRTERFFASRKIYLKFPWTGRGIGRGWPGAARDRRSACDQMRPH